MQDRLHPSDVFTPNRFPIEEHNVYAAREQAERSLARALGRNEVPVIYGEYGVGKTTLTKRYFREEDRAGLVAYIFSPAGKNLDDVARIVLEKLDYSVESQVETTRRTSSEAEIGGGGGFVPFVARFRGAQERGETSRRDLVVTTPTDQGMLELMADEQLILVIDEMHKASDGFRVQLADFIKSTSILGRGYPRLVVLGTTSDATKLVERDEGVDRLLAEIQVAPMTGDEAEFVVRDGMLKLGIAIDDQLVDRIVRTAAGAPALLQEICLDVAERVVGDNRMRANVGDVEEAIRQFLLSSRARLTRKYMTAIETVGPKRYRKQILRAMAESPADYVTMDELVARVSAQLGENVPSTALSGPLRELKQVHLGEILMDVERPMESEERVYNLNAFKDPRMKAFIRVMNQVEAQGLLPSDVEVEQLPELGEGEEEDEE